MNVSNTAGLPELECSGNQISNDPSISSSSSLHEDSGLVTKHRNCEQNLSGTNDCSDSDGEKVIVKAKKRVQRFSDSDCDESEDKSYPTQDQHDVISPHKNVSKFQESDDSSDTNIFEHVSHKSRLRKVSTSSDDSKAKSELDNIQESRITSKRNRLKEKFQSLVTKRSKEAKSRSDSDQNDKDDEKETDKSQSSGDEASSIERIRQIIKEKTTQIKSSIYDPDTSDEEGSMAKELSKENIRRKSTKLISPKPKPVRMSAKQAMENMQKIKSESNRLLREKEVSLPYHRPKALSLKDILSKRRPAISADGKALPIKMNEDQLRQFAQQLEQRQKEVIELCKSESEEETQDNEVDENQPEIASQNDTLYDDLSKTESQVHTNINLIQNEPDLVRAANEDDEQKNYENYEATNIDASIANPPMEVDRETFNIETVQTDDHSRSKDEGDTIAINNKTHNKFDTIKETDRNSSVEMELVYNDSVEESSIVNTEQANNIGNNTTTEVSKNATSSTEVDSQVISLHYDTEKSERVEQTENLDNEVISKNSSKDIGEKNEGDEIFNDEPQNNDFSEDDINMEDIDALIENAEITISQSVTDNVSSPMLIKDLPLTGNPKLIGAPGMVIDLDGTDPLTQRKLTGVELLKERFVFFAKLKTPEELERDREKRIKPGEQHLKLKQELEEQIAEQRSREWAKRLEDEKQHQKEQNDVVHDGYDDAEDDIDKIEAKLEEKGGAIEEESSSESEEEEEEEMEHEIVDKPRKRNPMVDDEAEESSCDESEGNQGDDKESREAKCEKDNDADDDGDDEGESEDESSEESEDEPQNKPKKGRILKAFEDSDDDVPAVVEEEAIAAKTSKDVECNKKSENENNGPKSKDTQDEEIHLAQQSLSEDLFTSQDSHMTKTQTNESAKAELTNKNNAADGSYDEKDLGTQTFSILDSTVIEKANINLLTPEKLAIPFGTQPFDDNLDAVARMCSGSFSQTQNLVSPSQVTSEVPPSQVIGDDVLAMCTGHFYDNQFVSQVENENTASFLTETTERPSEVIEMTSKNKSDDLIDFNSKDLMEKKDFKVVSSSDKLFTVNNKVKEPKTTTEDNNLKSILDELNDPEFDTPKPCKYFVGDNNQNNENQTSTANTKLKKKFVIDSDDEETEELLSEKKKKKIKKKKLVQRALQISDDEEDEQLDQEEEYESEIEEEVRERIVEYDSEENEVIVQPQNPKKKRKMAEFFENEAELTSEDEWMGSGDEDEAGLDRMEREEGDSETFNQGKLQRELGQIHMRDVLDQDKREVRLIQELLFEDGDLGGGSRQRKFRWKNADGEDETGTTNEDMTDTQEEFESEEQWRKQRHEREMFLKTLKNEEEPDESPNITVNRTSMIKANLSKNSSIIFTGVDTSATVEKTDSPAPEKKTAKDIPSPEKPFSLFQQNFQGSLLMRGRGTLARLAALATPLANDDDTFKVGSHASSRNRNFVFAAVEVAPKDEEELKVNKRKADSNPGTPRLVKKMRTDDKEKYRKSSLLDHLNI